MTALCASMWHGLDETLKQLNKPVVFDIGANEGGMAVSFFSHTASEIHMFEPVPDMAQKARDRFKDDSRVIVNEVAVGDREGRLENVNVFNTWSLLPQGSVGPAIDYAGKPPFSCPIITIDSYVDKTGVAPDFIKLDVDGYELRVLKGSIKTIERKRPPMLFEYSFLPNLLGDSVPEMCHFIYRLGYRAVSMDGRCECATAEEMLLHFPHHTSYDIMLLPPGFSFPKK